MITSPRGRLLTAQSIIRRWYMDAETECPLVTARWLRTNMPYKQKLSHKRVAWYENDVITIIAQSRAHNISVRDVLLAGDLAK